MTKFHRHLHPHEILFPHQCCALTNRVIYLCKRMGNWQFLRVSKGLPAPKAPRPAYQDMFDSHQLVTALNRRTFSHLSWCTWSLEKLMLSITGWLQWWTSWMNTCNTQKEWAMGQVHFPAWELRNTRRKDLTFRKGKDGMLQIRKLSCQGQRQTCSPRGYHELTKVPKGEGPTEKVMDGTH